MKLELSEFGERLSGHTGIQELMHDLGVAMSGDEKLYMLGGGNPAAIPEVQAIWLEEMKRLMETPEVMGSTLVNYDIPRGSPAFMRSLAAFLNRQFGWTLSERNIAITNGSQTAFFALFNMLAGHFRDGRHKKILLPLAPEYIGYADQGIAPDFFVSALPKLERIDAHTFKYHVDFDALEVTDDIAAICVSRPTNPTGNVLTNREIEGLSELARTHDIPLIIDNAYGAPFPGIIFSEVLPIWEEHIILSLSLSKLGLPGTRTGIIIAREDIISALAGINAVVSLANGNVGQALVRPLLEDNRILTLSHDVIRPFYEGKARQAIEWMHEFMPDELPWRLHKCEGAMFLWLWCEGLPITSRELYLRLRERGVLVVSGHYFFYGNDAEWPHTRECIRINYSQPEPVVREGLRILAETVTRAYEESGS